jgi:GTP-binding protein
MGHNASPRRRLIGMEREATTLGKLSPQIFPPRAIDPERVEEGRRLFAREARFVAGASGASALPPEELPEIAFAGRSNVGKSSLGNALTGRRMLARISNTPGRTRQINFFDLGGRLILVDLPGYGYADASKAAIRAWTEAVRRYLQTRAALRRVCLLLDSRHGIKEVDRPLMRILDDAGVSYQIVLTKTDKAAAGELRKVLGQITAELATHAAAHREIHLTSAIARRGIPELHESLGQFAVLPEKPR